MAAVASSAKLVAERSAIYARRQFCSQEWVDAAEPFIPFSVKQERKLLESKLVSVLGECSGFSQVKQVHGFVFRRGFDQCCYVLAKLVRMVCKFSVPMDPYARFVLEGVRAPNPFLWTSIIRGYTLQGGEFLKEAILLYNCMRLEGVGPVSFTFCALFKACGATLDVNLGGSLHGQAVSIGGFSSDLYVGNTLIDMYVKCGFLEPARRVFDEMVDRDVISWTSLIVAYAKSGDMDAANELFGGMPSKDMVAWTAMVTGYAQNAKPKEALGLFEKMQNAGVKADEVTLVGAISACAQLGATKYANWIRDAAENLGFRHADNVVVGSALIDMYSKCGSVDEAYRIFQGMNERNVYSYSSMIAGFAMHGQPAAALQLFKDMLKTEIKPNGVTFIGVLTACSHTGMVKEGWQLFTEMRDVYRIEPTGDHYACMADLLSRAGHLDDVLELIKTMPMEPNGGVWGALLGASRIHGNPATAQVAANHLFEIEPNAIGNYVVLCNIYASAGYWDDVSRIRKLMAKKGMRKNPACSQVEAQNGIIHEFFAGDMRHPRTQEIKKALGDLYSRLEIDGYQPVLSSVPYDMDDEEKRRVLRSHSEKLALAFGLLSTQAGSTVRIMKNIRICEDCHSFMTKASQITGREIVIRDGLRFHHFRDGLCSCNNFW
uniref:DYW domain-containing protein n=1 Tax=Kalanchoe fedtschenkoi TaxID=63787 RepID=A0A7N0UG98_KALFE